jgi:NDP-sugar pyrophosphorylase family protein
VKGQRALTGGIIAAGEGSRLRRAGSTVPKPLVPVAGVPLIASVIGNFQAAGIRSLRIILNERHGDCVPWVRARFPAIDFAFVVKTTVSSLESFVEIAAAPDGDRMLISTVDAWCPAQDFVGFVEAALRRARAATVLAVTSLVADEKPLWVDLDDRGRITALGRSSGALVTAGLYLVSSRVRQTSPPPGLGRLREYLAWLHRSGEPMYGEVMQTVVDVDRPEDVALAEALARESSASFREE